MISSTDSNAQDPLVASDEARFVGSDSGTQRKDTASDGKALQDCQAQSGSDTGDVAVVDSVAAAVVPTTTTVNEADTWTFVYAQLARQLEYYFSEKNLSKDTYLQTLRQLNDGCVPVSILANFAMVKRLVMSVTFVIDEEGRLAAVEEAARNHSDRLMICLIDTKTGLRVTDEAEAPSDSSHRIPAVGTVDGKPLTLDTSIPQPSPIVKTIVLRDVLSEVTLEEIYELFNFEGFPPVTSIQPDVANCWFVTLDTEDKNAVLEVLLSLRPKTLRDHPVHARLKSTVVSAAVDTAPVMPWVPPIPEAGSEPVKRKKKKSRGRKKKSGAAAASQRGKNKETSKATSPPPPTLGEENFPTLQDKTVEWDTTSVVVEKDQQRRGSNFSGVGDSEDEEERNEKGDDLEDDKDERKSFKAMSDGASTATTTSSSLESLPKKTLPTVGYAAALMGKPDEGKPVEAPTVAVVDSKAEVNKVPEDKPVSTSLAPRAESGGGRHSFADILRVSQENAATASS